MSFWKKRFGKSKTKQLRTKSDLEFQKGLDRREDGAIASKPVVGGRKGASMRGKITILEQQLNSAETRKEPPKHFNIIRNLANFYLKLGND